MGYHALAVMMLPHTSAICRNVVNNFWQVFIIGCLKGVKMNINGYELIKTCGACPEQYDVLLNDKIVGYLRLRHGYFYASVPDVCGDVVYEAEPKGDGIFEEDERIHFLTEAVNAISAA